MNYFRPELRKCPVCGQSTYSHTELVPDDRGEVVFYYPHRDGIAKPCPMSGKVAALAAVESVVAVAA